jgi:hypothetical protein
MRFIRRCLAAARCVLVSLGSAQAVAIGETGVLSAANGNLLLAKSKLSRAATVERACPPTSLPSAENVVSKVRRCSSTPRSAR